MQGAHNNGFSLVGIQGNDIVAGNQKLALALFWQLVASPSYPPSRSPASTVA